MAGKNSTEQEKTEFPGFQFDELKKFFEACAEFNMKVMNAGMNLCKEGVEQDTYKKFLNSWQDALADFLDKHLRSPAFCNKLAQDMTASLFFKKHLDEMMLTSLKNLKLPSREDLKELFGRIDSLEEKIDQILENMEKK
ncbi:hypothetical protein HYY75_11465 [bacterium]|nr:hypothetical protein [bacterium]